MTEAHPFLIKDCALVAMATGHKAMQLPEFCRQLAAIEAGSIYYHFWGSLLQPRFEEREYNNDFASWMEHGIHDTVLAERLALVDPSRFFGLEALRSELVELIEARMDEAEHLHWTRASVPFEFVRSKIVVFDTRRRLQTPTELADNIGAMSTGSIFYHFIDARRRTNDGRDDFSDWLSAVGHDGEALLEQLAEVDPYFDSLSEVRDTLASIFAKHFSGSAA